MKAPNQTHTHNHLSHTYTKIKTVCTLYKCKLMTNTIHQHDTPTTEFDNFCIPMAVIKQHFWRILSPCLQAYYMHLSLWPPPLMCKLPTWPQFNSQECVLICQD